MAVMSQPREANLQSYSQQWQYNAILVTLSHRCRHQIAEAPGPKLLLEVHVVTLVTLYIGHLEWSVQFATMSGKKGSLTRATDACGWLLAVSTVFNLIWIFSLHFVQMLSGERGRYGWRWLRAFSCVAWSSGVAEWALDPGAGVEEI